MKISTKRSERKVQQGVYMLHVFCLYILLLFAYFFGAELVNSFLLAGKYIDLQRIILKQIILKIRVFYLLHLF